MPAGEPTMVLGVLYPSRLAACEAFGHAPAKIDHRVRSGLSFEQAILAKNMRTGVKKHPSYNTWNAMMSRCYSSGCGGYKTHGARGITVCDRWRSNFAAFVEDMGIRPSKKHTLDRIKGELGYSKENCRWATMAEQNRNRRDNVFLTFQSRTLCLADWASITGLHSGTITFRLKLGWSISDALTKPSRKKPGSIGFGGFQP